MPCPQVKRMNSQNHGQISLSPRKAGGKARGSGLMPGTGPRTDSETFSVSGSVPLGHCYHAERRLFLGDRGYLCVFLQISSLFKMSAAPCFSKPVNAESSLARLGLDLVYLMVCSGSYRLSHGPDLVFIWLGDRKETPSGVTCDRSSLSHAQGPGRRHIFCRFTELLYLVVSSLSLRASTQRLHNYLQGIARSTYFYHMKNLPRCQLRALQG